MIDEANVHTAPHIPTDRPPTRAEVWAHVQHYYGKSDKTEGELARMAGDRWAGNYVYWFNLSGWRKQPDWKEGDPVIPAGVPDKPFEAGSGARLYREVVAWMKRASEGSGE